MRRFLRRLHNVVRPTPAEEDLTREVGSHLSLMEDEFRRQGMAAPEARLAARRAFGGVQQAKELHRDARSFTWLEDAARDIRYGLRSLSRKPGFTVVAVLTLALGIGAPTAIFSVVRAVLLRPLPYPEPDRIVRFRMESRSPAGPVGFDALPTTTALAWGANSTTLSAMGLFNERALTLSSAEGPFRLSGISATPNLFDLLGVKPILGRAFAAAAPDAREIVLSHATWNRFFRADPAAIGAAAMMDGEPYRIVGVMPEAFGFPTPDAAFWVPLILSPDGSRGMLLPAIARLRPGATLPAVLQEGRAQLGDAGDARITRTLLASTLQDQMVGGVRRMLWVLLGAVAFVLVIATVNLALLLLTRGASREREFSIRQALGAGRTRLIRQLFVEGLTLGAVGGVAGVTLAALGLELLIGLAPADIPRLEEAALDRQVLAFALVLSGATSLAFGVLSAGRTLAINPIRALGGAAGPSRPGVSAGTPRRRLNVLAAGELALTMVLLVGAALLLRSFAALVLVDQGFEPRGSLALRVNLPVARYSDPDARMAFHERLLEALKHADGVDVAGFATTMPNRQPSGRFDFSATPLPDSRDPFATPTAGVHMVGEGFIEAMGLHLRAGRTFRPEDGSGSEEVVIVSEQLARQLFANRNPVGALLYSRARNRRVVGVVGDVRPAAPGAEPTPTAYLPLRQNTDVLQWFASMNVVVRGANPRGLAASMRSLVLSLDPEIPPSDVRGLEEEVSRLVAGPRFSAALLGAFAFVALVMASVGVYGVMAYSVAERTHEIGIRMALGAQRSEVMGLVLRQSAVLTAVGICVGLAGAAVVTRYLEGMLFGLTPFDPLTFVAVSLTFAVVTTLAAYVPARRATKVDPLSALRCE